MLLSASRKDCPHLCGSGGDCAEGFIEEAASLSESVFFCLSSPCEQNECSPHEIIVRYFLAATNVVVHVVCVTTCPIAVWSIVSVVRFVAI